MIKTIVAPILLMVLTVLSLLACIGERRLENKTLYAGLTIALAVILLICVGGM